MADKREPLRQAFKRKVYTQQRKLIKGVGGNWKVKFGWNLWWYADITLGTMSVGISDLKHHNTYLCLISDGDHKHSGLGNWTVNKGKKCIVEAVKEAMKLSEKVSAKLKDVTDLNRKLTTERAK